MTAVLSRLGPFSRNAPRVIRTPTFFSRMVKLKAKTNV